MNQAQYRLALNHLPIMITHDRIAGARRRFFDLVWYSLPNRAAYFDSRRIGCDSFHRCGRQR